MDEKERMEEAYKFGQPFPEVTVTPEVRQNGYESFVTTDDHLMHLTGITKDQNGTKYYIINEITQERIVRDTKEELEEYINKEYKNARETGLNDLTIGLTKELKDTCTELNDPNHNKYKRLTLRSILGKYQNNRFKRF